MAAYNLTPYPLSMVICDACHRDPGTGKFFLLGLFSAISAPSFPFSHSQLVVYTSVTDGLGIVDLKLQFVEVSNDDEVLVELSQEANFDDPRMVAEAVYIFQGLPIPRPGEYRFKLFANNEFLIERRVLVNEIKNEELSHE